MEAEVRNMAVPQIYEGTTDEIVEQLRERNLAGKLRVIVVPENGVESYSNCSLAFQVS